ncbi:MAG: Putative sulfatase [uncultured Rubrobacteraceae bacterium]|uniref:Sulfatase n=1 Tax=uncultured Rubrobacteraceae bacterium TaxID=349277 RepID=A0A6J4QV61_9ACTN|nr:MAG: Putative sulfatase [uncultured Rubrobacteraceae bacterium]
MIVFFTDQQRWDTIGLHGNPLDLTPNLDRAAKSGTHLFNSFTPQPLCGPARSCLQTGLYATTTGCYRNGIPLPREATTLAHNFRNADYDTGYIGKWHLAGAEPVPEAERGGYQYWLASNVIEFTSEAYRTVVYDEDDEPVRLPGYRVDALTDAAIRYVDSHQDRPFFLFLSLLEPHHQNQTDSYPAPAGYAERYAGRWMPPDLAELGGSAPEHLAGYCGQIKRIDEAFGRLLEALESLGLRENTVFVFASDHGNHFKTRNDEYKRSPHESSIRVPIVLLGPGFEGAGRVEQLVSLLDLPPTLLDAAGLPVPDEMQGRSVLPLLEGEREGWPEEVFVQISESQVGRAIRTRRWKYCVVAPEADPKEDPFAERYVEDGLYDLESDPYELHNLTGLRSHRDVADTLKRHLIARMVEIGEPNPIVEPPSSIASTT